MLWRKVDIAEAVGGGYADFWRFRGRYRVVKGSRASKKSKTTALWYINGLRKYPLANLLVVRRTYASLERS
ncbi:MAG: PBSX family phage terminase large subunit, partial [Clostridiales bacterium]|nr:PBSX family phage terminase large subunit [Clostridiales bacterium]